MSAAADLPVVDGSESLRERLRLASLDPLVADEIVATAREAMRSVKRVRLTEPCHKCGCQHQRWVDVPDAVAAMSAAKIFAEHVEGRLGSAVAAESSVVVRRVGPRLGGSVSVGEIEGEGSA